MFLFLFINLISIFIGMCADNWFIFWVCMEVCLLSFIPILINFSNENNMICNADVCMYYFIIQCSTSSLILCSIFLSFFSQQFSMIILIISLMWKMGIPPFHMWVMIIFKKTNWFSLFLLNSSQKLLPVFFIFFFLNNLQYYIMFFLLIGLVISGMIGIYYEDMKSITACSSLGSTTWFALSALLSEKHMLVYFSVYVLTIFTIMLIFSSSSSIEFNNNNNKMYSMNYFIMFVLGISFFSALGMPPFMGFFTKMYILLSIFSVSSMFALLMMIASIFHMVYILNLCMYFFGSLIDNFSLKNNKKDMMFFFSLMMFFFQMMGLIFILMMF